MTQCLMLDVDGVLVTGRPQDGRPWATHLKRDLGVEPEKLHEMFFAPHWADIVVGRKEMRPVLAECLARINPQVRVDAFIDYWFNMDSRIDSQVLAQVGRLRQRNTKVFLATNQEHSRARFLMENLGLSKHVDGMIYSAAVSSKKPDTAFFRACVDRTGCLPKDLLLVDDTAANIEAARNAGWQAILWTKSSTVLDRFE
jgi:putative hydrolase of the HAD superfamily